MSNATDLIIIGGGIGGIVGLHYARKAGLNAIVLEKSAVAGGLWAALPGWQDIQQPRYDWAVDGMRIDGEGQPHIHQNILDWISRFDLAPQILLDTRVVQVKRIANQWQASTESSGDFRATNLLVASGVQNKAVIPDVPRTNSGVREYHSSHLHDPAVLRDRKVVVVGGGASAYDLIELALEHGARSITWVCRSAKWMAPTRKPKHVAGSIRWLGQLQMQGLSPDIISKQVHQDLVSKYEKFNLQHLLPENPFHFDRHQLIPGRRDMIASLSDIRYYQGQITAITEDAVSLSTGHQIAADVILWGTGYDMDLSLFGASQLSRITRAEQLMRRCASRFVSLDYPGLYFMGAGTINGIGSLPWAYAHAAMAIMAHIRGEFQFSRTPVTKHLNHFDFVKFLAPQNPARYQSDGWPERYMSLAADLPEHESLPLP